MKDVDRTKSTVGSTPNWAKIFNLKNFIGISLIILAIRCPVNEIPRLAQEMGKVISGTVGSSLAWGLFIGTNAAWIILLMLTFRGYVRLPIKSDI